MTTQQGRTTMRKLLLGLVGFAAIGLGAGAVQPALAQGFSITVGSPYYQPPVFAPPLPYYRPAYYAPVPVYRPGYGRRGYYRPAYYGPRCTVRTSRFWDGFSWVTQRREICR
jgi:hypothetical protein